MPSSITKRMKADAKCPVCGAPLRFSSCSEACTAAALDSGRPFLVSRLSFGECTRNLGHGLFPHSFAGSHVTMNEARFREMFPKAARKDVRTRLPAEARRAFDLMVHGKRSPDWRRLEEWRALVAKVERGQDTP
jgi:hypothetical protein